MAEEAEAQQSAEGSAPAPKKKLNKFVLLGGAVGGIALLQCAVLFFIFKGSGAGPSPALGGDSHAIEGAAAVEEEDAEAESGHGAKKDEGKSKKDDGHGKKKDDAHGKSEPKKDAHGDAGKKDESKAKKDDAHGEKKEAKKSDAHGAKKEGGHGDVEDEEPVAAVVEISLAKSFKVINNKTGRMYIYDFDIAVTVAGKDKSRAEKLVKERNHEIADVISQVVRGADQKMLAEDDLRVLRQHILRGLADVAEDEELFQKVLIPRCVPLRAD